jgi:golgi-specific brefeldin A-resistance guanine nucleotide exchange factor 1
VVCCHSRRIQGYIDFIEEILRKAAESTMHDIVRTVFSKLHSLDPVVEELKLQAAVDEAREAESKMTVSIAEGIRDEQNVSVAFETESEKSNALPPRSTPVESPVSKSDCKYHWLSSACLTAS